MEGLNLYPINYVWKIPKKQLQEMLSGWNEKISSDRKQLYQISGISYGLKAFFKENDEGKEILYITLVIYGLKDEDLEINGKFAFFIQSANFATDYKSSFCAWDGNTMFVQDDDSEFYEDWTHEICSKDDLFNREKDFIVDKHLIVEMKGMLLTTPTYPSYIQEPIPPSLGDYLLEREDKDFVIVVGKEGDEEKVEIKVHKLILASCSTVFDKMLQTDMKEKSENKLDIVDFNSDTVERAVEYCYDQDITYSLHDLAIALPLLQFADKYDMADLKNEIEIHLIKKNFSPENVVEIANAAIISNSLKLHDFCFRVLLIFMRQGLKVEKKDSLNKEFSEELLDKFLSGEDIVKKKIYERKRRELIFWGDSDNEDFDDDDIF